MGDYSAAKAMVSGSCILAADDVQRAAKDYAMLQTVRHRLQKKRSEESF